jgi:S-adenosylmethionine:tRNA ribosyltransferase-isomerase
VLTSDFDYHLPPELIAQRPLRPRDASRLMVLDRKSGSIEHSQFVNLPKYLHENDLLVLNNTRVFRARLPGKKLPGGGKVEILLLKQHNAHLWEAIVGGKGLQPGRFIELEGRIKVHITADLGGSRRLIEFDRPILESLNDVGEMPLPPYINAPITRDEEYQTIFAEELGSSAAPTAGLHFTQRLMDEIPCRIGFVTLHIGLDTFAPVSELDPQLHEIHTEWCQVSDRLAEATEQCRLTGGRILAVGTTSTRSLETSAASGGIVQSHEGATDLYILPGFQFRVVDGLITNFHLPRSTLLMMVSAFAGHSLIMRAYHQAISQKYRFYSFGDAMLIL